MQSVQGNPMELFPRMRQTSGSWWDEAETVTWRLMPIPDKMPLFVLTERIFDVEGFHTKVVVDINVVVYREHNSINEYWILQDTCVLQSTAVGGFNCPTFTVAGSRGTVRTFWLDPFVSCSMSEHWSNFGHPSGSLRLRVLGLSSAMTARVSYTATDFQTTSRALHQHTEIGDMWVTGLFLSAIDVDSFASARLKIINNDTSPKFTLPSVDMTRRPLIRRMSGANAAVTASSETSSHEAWRAFNRSGAWMSDAVLPGSNSEWLKIDMEEPVVVTRYGFGTQARFDWSSAATVGRINGWKLEGSNNNTSWTAIDVRTEVKALNFTFPMLFDFENTTAYRWYRLVFDSVTPAPGNPAAHILISRFQLYGNYAEYPPPLELESVQFGEVTMASTSESNPLIVEISDSYYYSYSYGNSINVTWTGYVPPLEHYLRVALFNKTTGEQLRWIYPSLNTNPISLMLYPYQIRDMWSQLGSPTGVREVEINLYDSYSSYYYDTVPDDVVVWSGSIWLDFRPEPVRISWISSDYYNWTNNSQSNPAPITVYDGYGAMTELYLYLGGGMPSNYNGDVTFIDKQTGQHLNIYTWWSWSGTSEWFDNRSVTAVGYHYFGTWELFQMWELMGYPAGTREVEIRLHHDNPTNPFWIGSMWLNFMPQAGYGS